MQDFFKTFSDEFCTILNTEMPIFQGVEGLSLIHVASRFLFSAVRPTNSVIARVSATIYRVGRFRCFLPQAHQRVFVVIHKNAALIGGISPNEWDTALHNRHLQDHRDGFHPCWRAWRC